MTLQLRAVSCSHPGKVRKVNEDSVFTFVRHPKKGEALGLLTVADGIGGHKAGDIASKIAVDTIYDHLQWFLDRDQSDDTKPLSLENTTAQLASPNPNGENFLETRLRLAIESANAQILEYAYEHPKQAGNMGTTITSILVWGKYYVLAHVGDSRAYLMRDEKLTQISEDHSFVGQMIRDGQLPPEAYYVHPRRNVITRALGQFEEVQIDLTTRQFQTGDKLLLCSDGLWEMVRDEALEQTVREDGDLDRTAQTLIELANQNGGSDNISVVIGEVFEK
jgi:protein phosphatase